MKLKKIIIILLPFILLSSLLSQPDKKKVKEFMEITSVELILRAFEKGKPVGGLKARDLQLFENGKKNKITSLMEYRRKIGLIIPRQESDSQIVILPEKKRRLFIFFFFIYEDDVRYREALNYFFDNVYKNGDTVLFITGSKLFQINSKIDIEPVKKKLGSEIENTGRFYRSDIRTLKRELETLGESFLMELNKKEPDMIILENLEDQIEHTLRSNWMSHNTKYLTFNKKLLSRLSESLKKINAEKWGMVFYQEPVFPNILIKPLTKMRRKFITEFNMPDRFFREIKKIKKTFINADVTFHLMLIPESKKNTDIFLQYTDSGKTYSGWRDAFRQITKSTGGEVVLGSDLKESIKKSVEREDIYYRVTYSPYNDNKIKRKIRIRSKKEGVKLLYSDRVMVNIDNKIDIKKLNYDSPVLKIYLTEYQQFFNNAALTGDISISLIIENKKSGYISTNKKRVTPAGDEAEISLKMKFPANSSFRVRVKVRDNYSKKEAEKTINIKT
ncbi:MAG: hypothetical protein ABFR75_09155 [Acidobacteriota bacterium]